MPKKPISFPFGMRANGGRPGNDGFKPVFQNFKTFYLAYVHLTMTQVNIAYLKYPLHLMGTAFNPFALDNWTK